MPGLRPTRIWPLDTEAVYGYISLIKIYKRRIALEKDEDETV
jgi:hypothetical protein